MKINSSSRKFVGDVNKVLGDVNMVRCKRVVLVFKIYYRVFGWVVVRISCKGWERECCVVNMIWVVYCYGVEILNLRVGYIRNGGYI